MNFALAMAAATIFALLAAATPAHAEDWTTTDGKVYKKVQVLRVEPDAVTIICEDGSAKVPYAKLPPDLQARMDQWGKTSKPATGEPRPPKKASQ